MKTLLPPARGYFAIGVEGISKAVNLGNLLRSARAFGASFVFLVDPHHTIGDARSGRRRKSAADRRKHQFAPVGGPGETFNPPTLCECHPPGLTAGKSALWVAGGVVAFVVIGMAVVVFFGAACVVVMVPL